MPTYEYTCKDCGQSLEVVQKFTDDSLTVCPNCGGVLRKVFGNVGISFKGSGFYKNDSRPAPASSSPKKESEPAKTDAPAAASTDSTPAKTETPAAAKPAETSPSSGNSKPSSDKKDSSK